MHDGVEREPVSCRAARPAVHDEVVGAFGNIGVKIVHQHALGSLGRPVPGRDTAATGGSNGSWFVSGN